MTLYKYRSLSDEAIKWTKRILTEQELFYASVKTFNDPFDGRVYLKFDGSYDKVLGAQARVQFDMNLEDGFETSSLGQAFDLVKEKITEDDINDSKYQSKKLHNVQELFNSKGVLSLANNSNNILMWSHYGNNHNGICFGFDTSNKQVFKNLKKVRYQSHFEELWGWLYTDDEIVENILYTKSHQWSYENEYRCINEKVEPINFDMNSLKEIIFGCIVNEKIIEEFRILAKESGFTGKFYRSIIDKKAYKLNLKEMK